MFDIIKKSILAGILIGFGVIINIQMEIPIIGPLLFSFGLLTIIYMKLYLFTGKIGFLVSKERMKTSSLILILLYNFIGIALTVCLYACANSAFADLLSAAAAVKFSKSIIVLFINACFCGALIHFAVKNKRTILTIFAIMIFILIGAEHCVADFPYFIYNFSWINCLKMISIIIGNSLGAIIIEGLANE